MSQPGADTEQDRVQAFTEFRQRMNQRILAEPNQVVRASSPWTPRPIRPARWR